MKRSGPIGSDPEKQRAWRERGARKYAEKRRSAPRARSKNVKRRESDGPWRAEVLRRYGNRCIVPGCRNRWLQADHVFPKGQGGWSDVRNGVPLCEEHHRAKTESRLLFDPRWLLPDTLQFLEGVGWVAWDDAGMPHGRGWKHFHPKVGLEQEKGGSDG